MPEPFKMEHQATHRTLRSVDRPVEGDDLVMERSHARGVLLTALERELFQRERFEPKDVESFCDAHRLDAEQTRLVTELAHTFMEERVRATDLHARLTQMLFPDARHEPTSEEWGAALFRHRTDRDQSAGAIEFERIGPFFSLVFHSADDFSAFVNGRRFFAEVSGDVRGVMSTDMIRLSLFGKEKVTLVAVNQEMIRDNESDTHAHELQHAMNMLYTDGRSPFLKEWFNGGEKQASEHSRRTTPSDIREQQQYVQMNIKDELLARIRSGKNPLYVLNMLYAKQYQHMYPDDKTLQMWITDVRAIVQDSINEFRQFMPLFQTTESRGVIVNQLMGVALHDFPTALRRMKRHYAGIVAPYIHEAELPARTRERVYPTRIENAFGVLNNERQQYLSDIGRIVEPRFMVAPSELTEEDQQQLTLLHTQHQQRMARAVRVFDQPFPTAEQPHAWILNEKEMRRTVTDSADVPWAVNAARVVVDVFDSYDQEQLREMQEQGVQSVEEGVSLDSHLFSELKQQLLQAIETLGSRMTLPLDLEQTKFLVGDDQIVVDCFIHDQQSPKTEVRLRVSYRLDGVQDDSFWNMDF